MQMAWGHSFRIVAAAMCCGALCACAAVPPVNKAIEHAPAEPPKIVGAQGPLSEAQTKALIDRLEAQEKGSDLLERHLAIERALAGSPLIAGNRTKLLHDGPKTLHAVFQAIRAAKHYILLEYYIVENVRSDGERLANLLIAKRRQGVDVAIIYDGYGSMDTPATLFDRLKRAGVAIIEYHPLNPLKARNGYAINDRDHRKILVADGATAILGGVNLYTVYQRHPHARLVASQGKNPTTWHDTDIEIRGPAAQRVQKIFLEHWFAEGGKALPALARAPPPQAEGDEIVRIIGSNHNDTIPRYDATLLSAIRSAQKTIWLTTAYFVPTEDEMHDLEAAAQRGVDVRLMLPSKSDSALAMAVGHSDYEDLLEAGVKIFEYEDGRLHSKCVVIDGVWSTVGSSNFDHRSVLFNDEVDAVILGPKTARQLEAQFTKDETEARRITLSAWEARPLSERIQELYSRTVANLL
jgi:cardiolipin synthase A/B